VSVSKKVAKSAVVRNAIRRRSYAALEPRLQSLPRGLYLLSAKPGADKLRGEALEAELSALLKQA
jgi:ribonuclease P protein component